MNFQKRQKKLFEKKIKIFWEKDKKKFELDGLNHPTKHAHVVLKAVFQGPSTLEEGRRRKDIGKREGEGIIPSVFISWKSSIKFCGLDNGF